MRDGFHDDLACTTTPVQNPNRINLFTVTNAHFFRKLVYLNDNFVMKVSSYLIFIYYPLVNIKHV